MSKSDGKGMKRREEEQPLLFDAPQREKAIKLHPSLRRQTFRFHKEVCKALDLPSDTVFIRSHSGKLYYYEDEESVQPVTMNRIAFETEKLMALRYQLQLSFTDNNPEASAPPKRAEQLLLLILTKEEREYLVGDLAEEYIEIQSNHGERFAKLWYWKQVVASAWPLILKALRWGVLAYVGAWIRRMI